MSDDAWPRDAVADLQSDLENGKPLAICLPEIAARYRRTPEALRLILERAPGGVEAFEKRCAQTAANKKLIDDKLKCIDDIVDQKPAVTSNLLAQILTIQKMLPNDKSLWGAANKRAANRARTNRIRASRNEAE